MPLSERLEKFSIIDSIGEPLSLKLIYPKFNSEKQILEHIIQNLVLHKLTHGSFCPKCDFKQNRKKSGGGVVGEL